MSDKYKNKYRIQSTRLQHWDYGWNAAYFVTICTKGRVCYFGDVIDNVETRCIASPQRSIASLPEPTMQLSEIGKIVETEWLKTPELRPDMNLELGIYQVMPNHFHGIIIIGENEYNRERGTERRDAMHGVSTPANKFAPQSKNLGSIIRGFKSSVTTQAREIHADFAWQSRFHDHIIRDDDSFHNISEYIANNPLNWVRDEYYIKRP